MNRRIFSSNLSHEQEQKSQHDLFQFVKDFFIAVVQLILEKREINLIAIRRKSSEVPLYGTGNKIILLETCARGSTLIQLTVRLLWQSAILLKIQIQI